MPAGLRLRAGFERFVGALEIGSEALHVHHPQQESAEALPLDKPRTAAFGRKQEVVLAIEQARQAEPPQPAQFAPRPCRQHARMEGYLSTRGLAHGEVNTLARDEASRDAVYVGVPSLVFDGIGQERPDRLWRGVDEDLRLEPGTRGER
jgi:hypothetical protein